jgi:four helix bundle protein
MMKDEEPEDQRQRTTDYGVEVVALFCRLPKEEHARILGRQMLRSGRSVGAQYREGKRAKSNADLISKLEGALQELDETDYWLELLERSHCLRGVDFQHVKSETQELIAILTSIVIKLKRRGK